MSVFLPSRFVRVYTGGWQSMGRLENVRYVT